MSNKRDPSSSRRGFPRIEIKPMVVRSAEDFDWSRILGASQAEGHRMIGRLLTDLEAGANRFNSPGETLLAHVVDGTVVAACGLNREQATDFGRAGRVRRLYVIPARRREGLANSLVGAIAAFARGYYDVLTVRAGSPAAGSFFEHAGFQAVSHPNITHIRRLKHTTG